MAKTESSFKNMVITLFVVTVVAALALGGVYTVTKEPIAIAKRKKVEKAVKDVVPGFDTIRNEFKVPGDDGKDSLTFFETYKGDKKIGTAVKTYSPDGFGGMVWIMVGFSPDGTILNTAVLDHKETPGLGDKMDIKKSDFSVQFKGKNPKDFNLTVKKDGGDVDAITAATISSRAFCDAVKRAYKEFEKEK